MGKVLDDGEERGVARGDGSGGDFVKPGGEEGMGVRVLEGRGELRHGWGCWNLILSLPPSYVLRDGGVCLLRGLLLALRAHAGPHE